MKKRILTILLAACMALTLVTPIWAATENEAELPKLPAPVVRVLEEDEKIDSYLFKKNDIIILDIPDVAPDCRIIVRHENGETYSRTLHYGNTSRKFFRFVFALDSTTDPPKTEIYSISVRYEGNGTTYQDSDWTTISYAYTDPGTPYQIIKNPHWNGINPEYTLPENTDEEWLQNNQNNAYICIYIGLMQENGVISERYGASSSIDMIKESFIDLLNECGGGNFVFRVRINSMDIFKVNHGPWSEWSEPLHISPSEMMIDSLKNIAEDLTTESTIEQKVAAIEAVRALNTQMLTTALAADNESDNIAKEMAELEEKLGVKASVIKAEDATIELDVNKIDIIGAGLSSKDLTSPTLTISNPADEVAVPDFYHNTVQMDLSLDDTVKKNEDGTLQVPVRIIMPVPEKIAPNRLRILHFRENKTMQTIIPHVYQDEEGTWLATFVVNHLSPFAFVEQTATITFDSNGGVALEQNTAQVNAEGKLETLPTPTRENYTFEGWYTAKEGGEKVTIDTVFTQDTTLYAHWKAINTGNTGSSGDGGGGGVSIGGGSITLTTPTQPTTPTQAETPVQPEPPTVSVAERFADIQSGQWYTEAVDYVVSKGLMNGTSDTTFAPGETLSRAMLAQILYNNEESIGAGQGKFSDVQSDAWYADAVNWAVQAGIVTGNSDGTFNPNGAITREQIAVILYRYAQQKGYDTSKKADLSAFADAVNISEYAKEAMAWANASGLINGMDESTLAPGGNATRAQVAAILMRFLESQQ